MKKYVAELIGTFALVFCGTGAIIINEETHGSIGVIGIAITFGLVVCAMIYALGDISGAHFNPVVTISFYGVGLFPLKEIIPYILSQGIGAFLASVILKSLFPFNHLLGSTNPSGSAIQSFVLEIILSFILLFVIMRLSQGDKEQKSFAGTIIGSVVLFEALFAGPICGASMNPIRSIAPAIVSGYSKHLWIYCSAPVIGGILGTSMWRLLK